MVVKLEVWSIFFEKFNPQETVDRYYASWSTTRTSKYYNVIASLRLDGLRDDQIKERIINNWAAAGREASEAGTLMHRRIELFLNCRSESEWDAELLHFRSWLQEEIIPKGWRPFRTEWSIFDESTMIAGLRIVDTQKYCLFLIA